METGVDGAPVETVMLKGFVLKEMVRVLAATLFKNIVKVIVPLSGKKIIFNSHKLQYCQFSTGTYLYEFYEHLDHFSIIVLMNVW